MFTDMMRAKGAPKLQRPWIRRSVSRVHVALQTRTAFRQWCQSKLEQCASRLSKALAQPVHVEAELLATSFQSSRITGMAVQILLDLLPVEATALLELECSLASQLLNCLSEGKDLSVLPGGSLTRIEEAALMYCALEALMPFQESSDVLGPRLAGLSLDRKRALAHLGAGSHVVVKLLVTLNDRVCAGWLHLPVRGLTLALLVSPPDSDRPIAPSVLASKLDASARIGTTVLRREDLESLGIGDVVTFPEVRRGVDGPLGAGLLRFPGFVLHGLWTDDGFEPQQTQRRDPSEELTEMNLMTPSNSHSSLPVDVEIELGRVRVALSELSSLSPGAVLNLRLNPTSPVLLKIGDRAVARAELVDIEGEVGARILSLLEGP